MFPSLGLSALFIQSVILIVKCDCPQKGKVGASKVPDILTLIKGQSGFQASIEIITPKDETIMVFDNYNGAKTQKGHIEINKLYNGLKTSIYYYSATNEKYTIENGACESSGLELLDKYTTIGSWLVPDEVASEASLFGDMKYLGPTVLMIWAASVSSQAQYVATENNDGRKVQHFFHCLNDNIWTDFWFDAKTNLPVRFSLTQSNLSGGNVTHPHVYNYLVFNPLISSNDDLVSYPLGYGCRRAPLSTPVPEFPSFIKSETFSLDLEAMIMYSNVDKMTLTSVRMMKYQNTYSFEINDDLNTTRIIQNPKHRQRYVVNMESGECLLDSSKFPENADGLDIKWPFHREAGFNLLQAVSSTSGSWSYYMGQVVTDAGLMDVWEDGLYSFFSSGSVDVVVIYYFPAIDRSLKPHQAPVQIVIKPMNIQHISFQGQLPYQIVIDTIDYSEQKTDLQLSDRYDVSGCYDGPNQFTWAQIVMSDIDMSQHNININDIETYFKQALASFIPIIRMPELIVSFYEFNYYITFKLLERPPFIFEYETDLYYVIENPTSVLIREALEDCGELCSNEANCKEFSYCADLTCQLFISTTTYASIGMSNNCTWYRRKSFDRESTPLEHNELASTRSILSQIKAQIDAGQFLLSRYSMAAEDMFLVSGPEEIGSIGHELTPDQINPLKGDEYTVIASNRRLSSDLVAEGQTITTNGISYSDCLQLCQNDDDCYTLSYCSSDTVSECIISTQTADIVKRSLKNVTLHGDKCNIFQKSFVTFYRKFPGQSLVKSSVSTLFDIDETECARVCYQSVETTCKSFDYCLQPTENHGELLRRACFLHQFHAAEDSSHEISDKIWNFSTSTCDHYALQLSRDYVHYIGRQYKTGLMTIVKEIDDMSMERCAADCNQLNGNDDDAVCISFEYCESIATRGKSNIRTTCRLSSTLPTRANDDDLSSSLEDTPSILTVSSSTCSVYLNRNRVIERSQFTRSGQDHFVLAIGLGSFFFIISSITGTIGAIYYKRKFC